MTAGRFQVQITKTAKRCNFPNKEAEERAIRDVLHRGMNSSHVRDKCINFINNDNGELAINILIQHLEIEDSNSHHKSLSQLDSTTTVNFATYDRRHNKESKCSNKNGKDLAQKSSNYSHSSRIPPDMKESVWNVGNISTNRDKSVQPPMKGARPVARWDTLPGCAWLRGGNSKATRWLLMFSSMRETDTYENEPRYTQPCPPKVNMIKVINQLQTQQERF